MRGPTPADVLGRVTLVTGKEEFLSERTVAGVRDAVRRHDREAEVSETQAAGLTAGRSSASWPRPRCSPPPGAWSCAALENLPEESVDGLLEYAAAPAEDVALVLVHGGGQKGSGVLTKLRKLAAVTEVKSEELRASEYPGFVDRRGPAARRRDRSRRGRPRSCRRSARTSAPSPRPPTSSPTTSRARR